MGLHTASRKFVSRNITGQEKMGGCDEERKWSNCQPRILYVARYGGRRIVSWRSAWATQRDPVSQK
jgi:hypothetical protein